MRMQLQRTKHIPRELEPGILYVSEEFEFAAHLCACGCRSKIRTPLGPAEWEFTDTAGGPTLFPSVGNWQQKCESHYWITRGEVRWAPKWPKEDILKGQQREQSRRKAYYEELYREQHRSLWQRFKEFIGFK